MRSRDSDDIAAINRQTECSSTGRTQNRSIGGRRAEAREAGPLAAIAIEIRRVEPALERHLQSGPLAVDHRIPGGVAAAPLVDHRLTEQAFIAKAEPLRRGPRRCVEAVAFP